MPQIPFYTGKIPDLTTGQMCEVGRLMMEDYYIELREELTWLLCVRGLPAYVRSDNGPEFTAQRARLALAAERRAAVHRGGPPLEEGTIESFHGLAVEPFSLAGDGSGCVFTPRR